MSLVRIDPAPGTSLSVGQDFVRHSTRQFLALFDVADDEFYVSGHCGYYIANPHPTDPQQLVIGLQVDLDQPIITLPDGGLGRRWKLTLNYGPWDPLQYPFNGDPVGLPAKFRVDFTTAEVAAFEDVDGDPIVNAAGDPYDPPLSREVIRATLYYDRNEAATAVNLNTLSALANTINLHAWNGFAPKTVKFAAPKLPNVEYSQVTNQFYFPMSYQFDINDDTWVKQVINAGFRQLDADGNLIPILIDGQPATTPVPLDEEGHAILTPSFPGDPSGEGGDTGGDVPPDADPTGDSVPGNPTGGGEPPEGGTGVITGSNLVIDAYDLIRAMDFSVLHMDTIFTLPTLT